MIRFSLCTFSALCLGAALSMGNASLASAAQPAPVTQQAPLLSRLSNGMKVLIQRDDRFPLVSLRLYVHTGSVSEMPDQAGISHLLEHMVFKGTEHRPKGAVAGDIEKFGGYVNAATSYDYTVYLADMPAAHWREGMDVLRDMAFFPTIDAQELASEKEVVLAELKRGEDSPQSRLFRLTQERALHGTPYAVPIIGFEKTIRGITKEAIHAYIAKHYQPESMLLLVYGDVDPQEALLAIEKDFGSLMQNQVGAPAVAPAMRESSPQTATHVERGPWNKVHLAFALPVTQQSDPRSAKLDVLAHLLGGDATSRLYRTYKYEKRLVDSIAVANYSFEDTGVLYITATLDAEKLPAFWEAFTTDLATLGSLTVTEKELARAKLNIEDDLYRSKETVAGNASKLGYFQFFGDENYSEANYLSAVRQTTAAELTALAGEVLVPSRMASVVLLPQNTPAPKGAESMEAWLGKELQARFTPAQTSTDWLNTTQFPTWQHYTTLAANVTEDTATGPVASVEDAEIVNLGGGRTVILQPDATLPYTAVNLVFHGGNALLDKKQEGLATFTAALLQKGTTSLTANQMEDFQADKASGLGVSASRQSMALGFTAPERFLTDMLGLMRDVVEHPALLPEEASRVREQQIAAITMREDQPTGLAFRRLFPLLFPAHSYGYMQLGEKKQVATFTEKDAAAFWDKQRQMPWTLSVSGEFDREAIIAAAKRLPVPSLTAPVVSVPQWGKNKTLALTLPGREQAHYILAFPTVGFGHPDEAGLDVLQNVLSGQSGLLFSDLRDKQGLGYTVAAVPWKAEKAGMLAFYIGTAPEKLEQAREGFVRVIDNLHNTLLPEGELERAKNQMEGDYYREHQTLASRSGEAASLNMLGLPLDEPRKHLDAARKVTAADVQRLARTYLQMDKAYTTTVEPGKK